jgi:tetratricopeptide (TPR) repeat protein
MKVISNLIGMLVLVSILTITANGQVTLPAQSKGSDEKISKEASEPTTIPLEKEKSAPPKVNMESVRSLLDKARESILQGDEDAGKKFLSQITEIVRNSYAAGDIETSISIFRMIINIKSDYPDALLGLADIYRQTNPVMAVEYYTRYIQNNTADPAAYYGRGTCYLSRNANSLAIQDLKYLVENLDSNNIGGLTNLALAYRNRALEKNDMDMFKLALDTMQRAVQAAENSKKEEDRKMLPDLKYRAGRMSFEYAKRILKTQGGGANLDESIRQLQDAVQSAAELMKENPDDPQILEQIIYCYDAISEVFNAKIETNPKDKQSYIELARLSNMRASAVMHEAQLVTINYLKKALQIDPSDAELNALIAETYQKIGLVEKAIESINQAIKLSPDNETFKKFRSALAASTQPKPKEETKKK